MNTELIRRFIQLIAVHTGIGVREEEANKLVGTIRSRAASLQRTPEAYYRLLALEADAGRHEWEELSQLLTIGESYFFRDSGQFTLLRQRILPELIERNSLTRALRIWSAGCSTGEEPYSLAILLHELLPIKHEWDVVILGTDLNNHAIAAARRGMYRYHSLRALDEALRNRYFRGYGEAWELDGRFRSMVDFRQVNLLKDPFPDPTTTLSDVDLILCRNVFIYFDRGAVSRVLAKFIKTLKVGGYLMTGHAELHDQQPSPLSIKPFPESIIYRRDQAPHRSSHTTPLARSTAGEQSTITTPPPPPEGIPMKPINVRQPRITAHSYAEVPHTVAARLVSDFSTIRDNTTADLYTQARDFADAGNYEAAIHACQQAIANDSLSEKPYYLLAQIAEAQDDLSAAKNFLKKLLYLSPASVAAHLELGDLYAREQDQSRALKMFRVALELLKALSSETVIEPFANLSASQLLPAVQRRIEHIEATLYTSP